MELSLRYMYNKTLSLDPNAVILDEHVAPLKIEWIGVASTRFASHGGFLYFVTDENEVPSPPLDKASMFGCVVGKTLSERCRGIPRIVVSDTCDFDKLFNYLVMEIERYRNWHNLIGDLLVSDASYQELVDATAKFVPRPMYIADASWRMISRVDFEMPEISATWHYQILHDGLYPYHIVEALNRTGDYQRISNLPRASLIDSEVYTIRILAKPIRHHGKLVGYYFMIDTWGDLGYCEVEIAQEFGTMIAPLMAARGAKSVQLSGFQDTFIYPILDGLITSKLDIAQQLKAETHWSVDSDYRLVTVQFEPDEFENHLLHMRTMGMLMGDFESHAYSYKDTALAIFHCAEQERDDFMEHLESCCAALKRFVVVSSRFSDFSQLASYYEQNVYVYGREASNPDQAPRVITCDSLFPERLADLCNGALPNCFEMNMLHAYDLEHGTSYCLTLLEFLKNERNTIATSKALFVHRNTLRNRLDKISEIVDIDLDDPETRFRIIISLNTLLKTQF